MKIVSKSFWLFVLAGVLVLLAGCAMTNKIFYKSLANDTGISVEVNQSNAEAVFADPSQYSSITLTSDIDMSDIVIEGKSNSSTAFSGVLNGNGFSVSNLSFVSTEGANNFGLIPLAQNATIKNIKISGSASFVFSQTDLNGINVGLLVGKANGTTISNCEITVNDISLKFEKNSVNFGLLAGNVTNSQIYDIVVKNNLKIALSFDTQYNIGGIVGAFSSSTIKRTLFFGSITIESGASQSFNNVFAGGLIGFAQGADCQIKDNAVSIDFTSEIATFAGIIGQVSSNSQLSSYHFNYCYWSDDSLQAVGSNGEQFVQTATLTSVSGISYSFLSNKNNFDPTAAGFDFNLVFGVENTEIVLQQFQTFTFSFDETLNDYIQKAVFVVGSEEKTVLTDIPYNSQLNIRLYLDNQLNSGYLIENLVDFLNVGKILINNITASDMNLYQIKTDSLNNCFDISFVANGLTTGSYSFEIFAKTYQCEFTVKKDGDVVPGGVTFSGVDPIESRTQDLSVESKQMAISAIASGYHTFDHWNLYYLDESGAWIEQDGWANNALGVDSTFARLPIRFGAEPFDQTFKLEAVFSSENGVSINFINFDDERISSIYVQGVLYDNQPITILRTLTNASLIITMQNGYEFDSQTFVSALRTLYNQNITVDEVVSHSQNTQGQNVYNLTLNIAKICENDSDEIIDLSLPTVVQDDGSGNNLLWLWISLPCVMIFVGIAVFLIIYLHKRNQARNNVKKREKEINYKDFYI